MLPAKIRFVSLMAVTVFAPIAFSVGRSFPSNLQVVAQEAAKLKELQEERLAAARDCVKQTKKRDNNGEGMVEELIEPIRVLLEAELDVCESNKERIAVLEKVLTEAKETERRADGFAKRGKGREGTALLAKAERCRIEIALERAEPATFLKKVGPANKGRVDAKEPGKPAVQDDPKAEIAKLRAELAKLRLELEAAFRDIKSLKESIGQGKDQGALYRGKPARFWLDQFKDGDPKFRAEAVEALGSLVEQNKELIPRSPEDALKQVGNLSGKLAEKNKDLIPVLVTAFYDKDENVRLQASKVLGAMGPEVVTMLLVVLKDKTSPKALEGAADAVRRIGPKAKAAVPLLTEALKMDDWGVRRSCVTALGQIGPEAKPAIPAMVDVLGILLKNMENDAKLAKSGKVGVFGKGGLPFAIVDALVKIDPEVRDILPKGILTIGFPGGGPASGGPTPREQFQQAHTVLKKKYSNEK